MSSQFILLILSNTKLTSTLLSMGSIQYVLSQIDVCIQFGEDADVKIRDDDDEDFGDDGPDL